VSPLHSLAFCAAWDKVKPAVELVEGLHSEAQIQGGTATFAPAAFFDKPMPPESQRALSLRDNPINLARVARNAHRHGKVMARAAVHVYEWQDLIDDD